ncbi:uncharacterized protein LOC126602927 [Malus sylvestris]|uniref:uncharacterized protein LOC126602927 n=1 Tax=Malus sylvestris TaxID=3752 RepID=UPI0021AC38B4|nr:uncharacterized protein LOC126602927 [Malus sylvestris]
MALRNPNKNRTLMEYSTPSVTFSPSCIPNLHINEFLEICDTLKIHNMTDEPIRLRLFVFSLKDKAKTLLQSLPPNSITTWNDLMIDAASGGALMTKTVDEASALFNTLAANSQSIHSSIKRPMSSSFPEFIQEQANQVNNFNSQ